MKSYIIKLAALALAFVLLVGCANGLPKENESFDLSKNITAISRENGSGTKISFLDVLNLKENELHKACENIVSDTNVVLLAVESNQNAIGYLSHSELSPAVKTVSINGVIPTKENIISEKYPLSRTFYLVTKIEVNDLTQDFLNFIGANSDNIESYGYIPIKQVQNYTSKMPKGKINISGSSSVYPLIEKLTQQYKAVNPNAEIEINKTDSSNGIKNVENEISHIAMSSRELTKEELTFSKEIPIAKDAIAVIVNANNPTQSISLEQLRNIYTGNLTTWQEVK